MEAKINEIIEKNSLAEIVEYDGMLAARVVMTAYGVESEAKDLRAPTLGLYKDGNLIVKVKLPDPTTNPWFGIGFIYESPRIANCADFVVDFEKSVFRGNRKDLGFPGDTYTISYDFEVDFDSVRILGGKDQLSAWVKKAEVVD